MNELTFAFLVIILILLFIIAIDIYQRIKLKRTVREKWGKLPYQPRFDKEKSLKSAWLEERSFSNWDSEIDDITWNDLDMFDIFELINSTYSSVGSEALYQRLRSFRWENDSELEQLIQFFQNTPETRERIQYQFARLGKQDQNFSRHYLSQKEKTTLGSFPLFLTLGMLPIIGLLLFLLGISFGIGLTIASIAFNMLYYQIKKAQLETELNSMRYLVQTIATGSQIAKIEHPLQQELKKALESLKSIPRFGFSFRIKNNSEADMIFDYLNMMIMLPFISYGFVLEKLAHHHKDAIRLWELLGKLEVASAILNFRMFMPIVCQPTIQKGPVEGKNIYHPLLKKAVTNPVAWHQTTLVTGSNASGKSTYVKSLAINCILAQTIHTALAESFTLQAGHVLTSMAVEDSITEGDSYFVAEIKSVKRLLKQVETKEHCYCFIDEILKGTNTVERIAASSSMIHWLTKSSSLAMVATHDIEMTEILRASCENIHFSEQVTKDEGVSFDYRLKSGPAKTRNAIALLGVLGYPQEIIDEAKEEALFFDEERTWRTF